MFPSIWCANTQIQFWSKLQICLTYVCYIFWKVVVRGPQKQCSRVSHLQIHKYNLSKSCTKAQHVLYFWKGMRTSNKVPICLTCKYIYAKTQLHKPTIWYMPTIWYIFKNVMVRWPHNQCSQLSDMQIQIHKNTSTHIHIHEYRFGQQSSR